MPIWLWLWLSVIHDHADDDAGNPLRSRFHDLFRPSLYKVTFTAFHVFKDPYFHFLPLIMWHGTVHVHFFLMSISKIYFPLSYPESITYPPPTPAPISGPVAQELDKNLDMSPGEGRRGSLVRRLLQRRREERQASLLEAFLWRRMRAPTMDTTPPFDPIFHELITIYFMILRK